MMMSLLNQEDQLSIDNNKHSRSRRGMSRGLTLHIIPVFFSLLLAVLACNMPVASMLSSPESAATTSLATSTATANAAPEVSTPTDTQAAPAAASQAPLPTATSSQPCNLASFVDDITIPDSTEIQLNQAFSKTWRLKNVGTCTWTSGYALVFESGDQMGGPASQSLTNGVVAPGENLDITVNLVAPGSAGTYRGDWKIREPGGAFFGLSTGPFWVEIKAVAQQQTSSLPAWPVFKQGSQGPEVTAIQYLLRFHGQNPTPDGIYGPQTRTAVQTFQNQEGLSVDGIVGPQTWAALIQGAQVSQGKSGDAVRAVQTLLRDKYSYGINVDGIFGPKTASAVRDFQSGSNLTSDGIVGPKTWQALVGY
jgi:hypothetical protein